MAILNLKLDHILSFNDFNINFSYPNKIQNPKIENEYLKNIPSFRYKKLNVFIGSNATGKTSLMFCIWQILQFLKNKERMNINEIINKKYPSSTIEIDIAEDNDKAHKLHRFNIKTKNKLDDVEILVSHKEIALNTRSSYENTIKYFDEIKDNYKDYLQVLNESFIQLGWNIALPATESIFDTIKIINFKSNKELKQYILILKQVLKTLDPFINNVTLSKDTNNALVINHETAGIIIVQNDQKLNSIPYLSTGTKYAFNIANLIYSMKNNLNGIYLIDEQFSYVNAEIEAAILSLMVSLLGNNEQIFFTTHNSSILSLGFPFHSFYFMKKEKINNKYEIRVDCASSIENRNNVSPKTIIDNDLLGTAPKLDYIFEIGETNE